MSQSSSQDRNLPASPQRLERARKEGQVARSRDLGHFAVVGSVSALLLWGVPHASGFLRQWLAQQLRFDHHALAAEDGMWMQLEKGMTVMMGFVGGLGLLVALVAGLAAVLSGGWVWTLKPVTPQFSRLDPMAGLGRLFSKHQLVETLKSCLLALIVGTVGGWQLWKGVDAYRGTLGADLPQALHLLGEQLSGGIWLLVLTMGLFAVVDTPLQRFMHRDRLKMTREEAKQELKDAEGNLEMKHRLRARMREMLKKRMMANVPKADLVVMNPTHYAVALKYDDQKDGAPRVVAKGVDELALRIRDVAKEAKVPVLESPMLARALYATTELDREVPAALYQAVAQVLAYVFRLKEVMAGRMRSAGELPGDLGVPPELDPHHPSHHPVS
jgi:flagellar biosynthetic protein FlhB